MDKNTNEDEYKKLHEDFKKVVDQVKKIVDKVHKIVEDSKKLSEKTKKINDEAKKHIDKNDQDNKNQEKKDQDNKKAKQRELTETEKQLKKNQDQLKREQDKLNKDKQGKRENESKQEKAKQDDKKQNKKDQQQQQQKKEKKESDDLNKKEEKKIDEKTHQCNTYKDCPTSRFGGVCSEGKDGVRRCRQHSCKYDINCIFKSPDKNVWGYCKLDKDTRQKYCKYLPKCLKNKDCDDGDACTKDICLKKYGYCINRKRCVDKSECTLNICIPHGKDKYSCKNPVKTCTRDKDLLSKKFEEVSESDKLKWLGKCSHTDGCRTCVVNSQCDDNNGCTADSCEQQYCLHRPIHNEWCDPKLATQPITYQSLPSLRDPSKLLENPQP
jgi:hypothetical protein